VPELGEATEPSESYISKSETTNNTLRGKKSLKKVSLLRAVRSGSVSENMGGSRDRKGG